MYEIVLSVRPGDNYWVNVHTSVENGQTSVFCMTVYSVILESRRELK